MIVKTRMQRSRPCNVCNSPVIAEVDSDGSIEVRCKCGVTHPDKLSSVGSVWLDIGNNEDNKEAGS